MSARGLRGDYRDSCTVCLQGTDSALALRGELEWIAAALIHLGIPFEEACELVRTMPEQPFGPDTFLFRVCQDCAEPARMTVGLLAGRTEVPLYVQWPR
jgi:hypothetical protein